jgi:Peptidase C13 family
MLKAFLLVIVGLSGDPEHGALFHKWGSSLVDASGKVGIDRAQVTYLGDAKIGGEAVTAPATKEEIARAFAAIATAAAPDDVVYVVLLGHGNSDGTSVRFNLPGPDMTATDFNALLRKLPARNIVFVNTASSSGPFVEELSGPGRTIITATRSGAEQYTTLFGGYFVEAFTAEAADADKNKRVSMLEAFLYAKGEVTRTYEREGLLATEHAMLDDNGDKKGSQDPTPTGPEGKLAAALSLGSAADAAPLPQDPKLRALVLERRDLERRVEALRLLKDSLPPAKYASELERLVTELAMKTREIRTLEGDSKP